MTKKQWVIDAILGKKVEKVPVGFWFHYLEDEASNVYEHPELRLKAIEGHKEFVEAVHPDFVKLMSDGYFQYPLPTIKKADDLRAVLSLPVTHEWINDQVLLVKEQIHHFPEEIAAFYNIFSPVSYLVFGLEHQGLTDVETFLTDVAVNEPETFAQAIQAIEQTLKIVVRRLQEETDVTGIYYSTRNIFDDRFTSTRFKTLLRPADEAILKTSQAAGGINILHVCGYLGKANRLADFQDYPVPAVNYAASIESLPIEDAQVFFENQTIIGGFDNRKNALLHQANQSAIEKYTKELLEKAPATGFIIGADCTLPRDINRAIFDWVRAVQTVNN